MAARYLVERQELAGCGLRPAAEPDPRQSFGYIM